MKFENHFIPYSNEALIEIAKSFRDYNCAINV